MSAQTPERLFTVDEYHHMAHASILSEDDRIGIRELWLVDLKEERIEGCAEPSSRGCGRVQFRYRGERLSPAEFPDLDMGVDDISFS